MGSEERQRFVDILRACLGWPYVWGSNGENETADCSGLLVFALRKMGKIKPADDLTAHGLYAACPATQAPRLGDFAFYGTPKRVSHVVAFIGGGEVISASGGGPLMTSAEIARQRGAMVKIHSGPEYRRDLVSFGSNFFMEE